MANTIQIIIEAIDKTGGALSGISSYFSDLGRTIGDLVNNPFVDFLKDSIKYTQDYGVAVSDFSRTSGLTIEESSRLIQTAKDFGVSYEDLMKGVENATKNGTEVTIEELGKIADEYRSLDDPVGQAQLLVNNFGQAGLGMGALFEQGKEGILSAMGEVDEALVIDPGEKTKLDAYATAAGDFEQAIGGLKVAVGTELMPALTDFFEGMNEVIGKFEEFDAKWRIFYLNATTMGGLTLWNKTSDMFAENFIMPELKFAEDLSTYQAYRDYMQEILDLANLTADGYGAVRTRTGEAIEGVIILTEEEWKAKQEAQAIANVYSGMPDEITKIINVEADFSDAALEAIAMFGGGGGGKVSIGKLDDGENKRGPGGANGLDFVVPPGYPGDSFPFRAQSGERVQVTPKSAGSGDGFDYDRLIRGFVEALERSSLVR